MRLFLNSRKGTHSAIAEYDKDEIVVLEGSKINMKLVYPKMPSHIKEMREDRSVVSSDGKVLTNVVFDTPTSAAQFVTGRSANGYIVWRPDNKMSLKQYLEEHS